MKPLTVSSEIEYMKAEDGKGCHRRAWFLANKNYGPSWIELLSIINNEEELSKVKQQLINLQLYRLKHSVAEELFIENSKYPNPKTLEYAKEQSTRYYNELIELGVDILDIEANVNEFVKKANQFVRDLNINYVRDVESNLEHELFGVSTRGRIDIVEEDEHIIGWEIKLGKPSEYHVYQAYLYWTMPLLSGERMKEVHIVYLPNGPHLTIQEDYIIHNYESWRALEFYDSNKLEGKMKKYILGLSNSLKKKKDKVPKNEDFCPTCFYRFRECR